MSDHVYKKIELTGSSTQSIEDAVQQALNKASKTLHNLRWFELAETRGEIDDKGQIKHWQVSLKVGFRIDG
ncbi:dodecin [Nitrosococcus wardiae]|uniref:Dodecin domain-containing protein n=1 Tax=Nitrosococcus wardiae TaxID=1814290 RepID=A0A4P7C2V5_9GAMM|nr:dodecin [Nitrosococcus wardiae]QBQ55864.1 dodecin domain-containing protein [Nitrosococcus wardiae]